MADFEQPINIYWTKDAFKYNHSLFSGAELVGEVKDKTLHRSVKAFLFGQKYIFEKTGFVNTKINIINLNDRIEVGKIKCTPLLHRVTINLSGDIYTWRFKHMLTRQWNVRDQRNQIVLSGKSRKEGYFSVSDDQSALLLLCSLVIRNHFAMQGYS